MVEIQQVRDDEQNTAKRRPQRAGYRAQMIMAKDRRQQHDSETRDTDADRGPIGVDPVAEIERHDADRENQPEQQQMERFAVEKRHRQRRHGNDDDRQGQTLDQAQSGHADTRPVDHRIDRSFFASENCHHDL